MNSIYYYYIVDNQELTSCVSLKEIDNPDKKLKDIMIFQNICTNRSDNANINLHKSLHIIPWC